MENNDVMRCYVSKLAMKMVSLITTHYKTAFCNASSGKHRGPPHQCRRRMEKGHKEEEITNGNKAGCSKSFKSLRL